MGIMVKLSYENVPVHPKLIMVNSMARIFEIVYNLIVTYGHNEKIFYRIALNAEY